MTYFVQLSLLPTLSSQFEIFSNLSPVAITPIGFVSSTVTKANLLTGVFVTVPYGANLLTVKSIDNCEATFNIVITSPTTTLPPTTTTTTVASVCDFTFTLQVITTTTTTAAPTTTTTSTSSTTTTTTQYCPPPCPQSTTTTSTEAPTTTTTTGEVTTTTTVPTTTTTTGDPTTTTTEAPTTTTTTDGITTTTTTGEVTTTTTDSITTTTTTGEPTTTTTTTEGITTTTTTGEPTTTTTTEVVPTTSTTTGEPTTTTTTEVVPTTSTTTGEITTTTTETPTTTTTTTEGITTTTTTGEITTTTTTTVCADQIVWETLPSTYQWGYISTVEDGVSEITMSTLGPSGVGDGTPGVEAPQCYGGITCLYDNFSPSANVYKITGRGVGEVAMTFNFSQPLTNPILAIWSLGSAANVQRLKPNTPFIEFPYCNNDTGVLCFGNTPGDLVIYDSGVTYGTNSNVIQGNEGYGVIQFIGTFSQIVINTLTVENRTNFIWGIPCANPGPSYTTTTTTAAPTTTTTTDSITTTTTTDGLTTTTTTSAYTDYYADKYNCETCTLVASNVMIALPISHTPVYNNYYATSLPDGYAYKLISSGSPGPGLILNTANSIDCSSICLA